MGNQIIKIAEDSTRSGFYLFSGQVLSTIILAASSILIARLLGPTLYGQYTLALVTPQLLFIFTDLGISQGIIKFTASLRVKGKLNRAIKTVKYGFIIRLSTGIAIFALNFIFADSFAAILLQRPELTFYVRIASISVFFQAIYSTVNSTFVGFDKTEYNAILTNLQAASKALISIILVVLGFEIFGAIIGHIIGYVAATVSGMLLLMIMLRKLLRHKSKGIDDSRSDIKNLLRYGAPLYVSILLTGFIPLYRNIILAFFVEDIDIGNYRAAINFITLLTMFSIPITTALLPAFSKLNFTNDSKLGRFFELANKYTSIVVIPLTLVMIIFSKEIVELIYGPTYTLAPIFLAMYCLVYLLTGFGYLTLMSFYNGIGKTKLTLQMNLISFLIFTVLSPVFTSMYKVQGLIAAFIMANIASTLYGAYIAKEKFKAEFGLRTIMKIYIASFISAIPPIAILHLICLPILLRLITGLSLYLVIYITVTPILHIITKAETKSITSIVQKVPLMKIVINPLLKYQQKILKTK